MKIDSKSSSSIWVVFTRIVTVLFSTMYSVLSKYLLGDKATAIIGSMAIVNSYNRYVDIALDPVVSGITRRTPEYLKENKNEELKSLTNSSFSLSMIIALVTCLINLVLGFFSDHDYTKMLFFTMAFGSVFKVMNRFITVQKAAVMQLILLSRIVTYTMIGTYLISIILIYSFSVVGFYISSFLISSLSGIILYVYFGWTNYSFEIDFNILKKSIFYSVPMLIFGLSEIFIFTIDKILLSNSVNIEDLGIYSFSFQSSQILFGLIVTYLGSMYSYYVIDFSNASKRVEIFDLFNNEITKLLIVLSLFIIGLLVFFELITTYILTDFVNGLPTLYLFTTISIMFAGHYLFYIYLLVFNENALLVKISILSIVISLLFCLIAYYYEASVLAFAMVVIGLYFVRSVILVALCSKLIMNMKLIVLFVKRVVSFSSIPLLYFLVSYNSGTSNFIVNIVAKICICGLALMLNVLLTRKGREMLRQFPTIMTSFMR